MLVGDFRVIKYAPKVQNNEDAVVPDTKEAQPSTEDSYDSGHWADLMVLPESDDESQDKPEPDSKELWFVCDLCVYQCLAVELLLKHMMRKHTYIDEESFVCGFCKFREATEDVLLKHLEKHIPKKQPRQDLQKWLFYEDQIHRAVCTNRKRWTEEETQILEQAFKREPYLTLETKFELAKQLNVGTGKVANWFKNRRKVGQKRR